MTPKETAAIEATTAQIRGATRAVESLRGVTASINAAVKELTQIAISNADQGTRVRLVKEFADTFEASIKGG